MTLSIPRTGRFTIFAAALVYTGLSFGLATSATPAFADNTPHYSVELSAPTAETRTIAGGVAWACKEDKCVAGKSSTRAINVCRDLSRKFGEIKSFATKGEQLDAAKLAKCNGK